MIAISLPNRFRGWNGRRHTSELLRFWAKGAARITGISIKTFGRTHGNVSGLVVSNHLGYVDIVVHAAIFPLRFAPSTEVAKMPVVSGIVSASNPIFVDRSSAHAAKKAVRDFAKTMKRGMCLIVYPEGTSTNGKNGILPFKSTSFDAASSGGMPVIPILTRYVEDEREPSVAWYGDMTFFSHFWKVLGKRKIEAEVYMLDLIEPGGRTRKELASFVHDVMSREYAGLSLPDHVPGGAGIC